MGKRLLHALVVVLLTAAIFWGLLGWAALTVQYRVAHAQTCCGRR